MALFTVNRYAGDDIHHDEDKLSQTAAEKILELQIKAKSRKKKLRNVRLGCDSIEDLERFSYDTHESCHNHDVVHDKSKQRKKERNDSATEIKLNSKIDCDKLRNNKNIFSKIHEDVQSEKNLKEEKPSWKSNRIEQFSEITTEDMGVSNDEGYNPLKLFKDRIKLEKQVYVQAEKQQNISENEEEVPKQNETTITDKQCFDNKEHTNNVYTKRKDTPDEIILHPDNYKPFDHFSSVLKKEFGGFTILGNHKATTPQKVSRKLPDWLLSPFVIKDVTAELDDDSVDVLKEINPVLIDNLSRKGITDLFPVQQEVVPVILKDIKHGTGPCLFPPNDICVSAPTGSGKTLAFALPIVQSLLNRVAPATRALIVQPTRELASQVYEVFLWLCERTTLRCVLLSGSCGSPEQEEKILVKFGATGRPQLPDIVVATPGRLVNHLQCCEHFGLPHLRFLVIDEADRMMEELQNDWLKTVESAAYVGRSAMQKLSVKSLSKPTTPLQKLLFSATLSADPEKLEQLNLFKPKLYTAVSIPTDSKATEYQNSKFIGKYTTPIGLTERMVVCTSGEKPLVVLLLALESKRVLCFAGTIDTARRLSALIQLYVENADLPETFVCADFSSNLSMEKRKRTLEKFRDGKINILISSDAMARGMDIKGVSCVILYDAPNLIKTYIHRVGRTARAGEPGTAYTLLRKDQVFHFQKMLKSSGKEIEQHRVSKSSLNQLEPLYAKIVPLVAEKLKLAKK